MRSRRGRWFRPDGIDVRFRNHLVDLGEGAGQLQFDRYRPDPFQRNGAIAVSLDDIASEKGEAGAVLAAAWEDLSEDVFSYGDVLQFSNA